MLCLDYFDREIERVRVRYNEVLQQSITHYLDGNTWIVLSMIALDLIKKEILKTENEQEQKELIKEFVRDVITIKRELNRIEQEYKKKGGLKQKTETEMRKAA